MPVDETGNAKASCIWPNGWTSHPANTELIYDSPDLGGLKPFRSLHLRQLIRRESPGPKSTFPSG